MHADSDQYTNTSQAVLCPEDFQERKKTADVANLEHSVHASQRKRLEHPVQALFLLEQLSPIDTLQVILSAKGCLDSAFGLSGHCAVPCQTTCFTISVV